MIAIIPEPLIGMPGTLIGIVRNPHDEFGNAIKYTPRGNHVAKRMEKMRDRK
jgi:hypothetical protein